MPDRTLPDRKAEPAKVAIFISGSGTNMAALLYASRLPGCAYRVVLVLSNDPQAEGLKLAAAEGVPTFALPHAGMTRADHDRAMEAEVERADAEYIALAGYMRILSPEFVGRWEGRMLNIHPSLLPKYRGLDTYRRAIDAGDATSGASVHLVTADLDAGDVLGRSEVAILPGDTPETLARRVLFAEHQLYSRVLNDYVSRGSDPGHLLERVRDLALALPRTHERESHGSAGWRVGSEKSGKYFAYFDNRHHGSDHVALLVKTGGMDELETLIEAQPDSYFKPAYYGASGWIGVVLDRSDLDWDQVMDWLERSWQQVAPKTIRALLDPADRK